MAGSVVLLIGLAGLALAAWLLRREPDARIRRLVPLGAVAGFVVALLVALLLGTDALDAVATGVISAAVLVLVLLAQWRLLARVARGTRR